MCGTLNHCGGVWMNRIFSTNNLGTKGLISGDIDDGWLVHGVQFKREVIVFKGFF